MGVFQGAREERAEGESHPEEKAHKTQFSYQAPISHPTKAVKLPE